jgi:hypothetical protein
MDKREPLDDDEELAALAEFYEALPEAGTSLTDEERADIKSARAEYRRGDFIVDPHTART